MFQTRSLVLLNGLCVLTFVSMGFQLYAQTNITAAQFNDSRTAANLNESNLNTSNVAVSTFGKLGSFPVDGDVYAQPLYVHGLKIQGSLKNVLYVATMHNSIYAFDADNPSAAPVFHLNLGPSVPAHYASTGCPGDLTGVELGILSTPVLDLSRGTLYAVAATPDTSHGYVFYLHTVDLTNGQEKHPVLIAPSVPGTAKDAQNGKISLNDSSYLQRPGLVLSNGNVYVAFGSCGDVEPYHGWVIGYDTPSMKQTVVFNTTPDGSEGAIWQSGRAPVLDAGGNLYFMTGNGDYNGRSDFSSSFVKISGQGNLLGWFTPANEAELEKFDLDPSSSGPILTPDSNRLVGGGKDGVIYVLDPNALPGQGTPLQQFQATTACGTPTYSGCFQIHSIAYWASTTPTLYVWGQGDVLRAYRATGGVFDTVPASQGSTIIGYPNANLAVSSNGSSNGILWATTPPGALHAYDATNVSIELWNSDLNSARDALGTMAKFGQPIIADGKVFVPTFSNAVVAYGLLGAVPAAPSDLNFTVDFSAMNQVSLIWKDNSNNETGFAIERSTDGANFTEIARVGANVTSYSDASVQSYTYYYYRLRSYNAFGFSAYSGMAGYYVY